MRLHFALLHGEGDRPALSLYDMGSGSARVRPQHILL